MKPQAWAIRAQADSNNLRHETFNGVDHLVVPVVALVEGVVWPANAPQPELALASEFAKAPDGWNGRPIVMNHPRVNGVLVSANSPSVLASYQIGQMFNTTVEDKKLKSEMWINMDIVNARGGEVKEIIAGFESGEMIEVSTGLFSSVDESKGEWDGKEFEGIWRNVVPDHLAVLSKGTKGACSIEMGCGAPRVNSESEGGCGCGSAPCSCQKGSTMDPDKDKGKEKDKPKGKFAQALTNVLDLIGFKSQATGISHTDTKAALQAALEKMDPNEFHWIMTVYDDHFVYEQGFDGRLLSRKYKIEADGTIVLGENIEDVRPQTEFVPVKTKQEILMAKKDLIDKLVANTATQFADADRPWLETLSEDQLAKLSPNEQKPSAIPNPEVPVVNNGNPAPETVPASASTVVANSSAAPAPTGSAAQSTQGTPQPKVLTAAEYISQAPAEIQAVLSEGLRMQQARKETLVTALKANDQCSFSEEELRGMSLPMLENMAKLARVPDYSGQASLSVVANANAGSEQFADPAPALFPAKSA